MKKYLLGGVALAMLAGTASAADLPFQTATPAPVAAAAYAPTFTWTGFYAGVNAGYGFGGNGNGFLDNGLSTPSPAGGNVALGSSTFNPGNRDRDGFVGGGQAGYNVQFGNIVVGAETDIQYADFDNGRRGFGFGNAGYDTFATVPGSFAGRGVSAPTAGSAGNVAFFNNGFAARGGNIDWYGTVRGRVGYAFDRFLVFATGGLAYTDRQANGLGAFGYGSGASLPATFYVSPAAQTAGATVVAPGIVTARRGDDIGYVVGGGVEYAFTTSLSGRVEGQYVNFGGPGRTNLTQVVGVTNQGAPVVSSANVRGHDLDFGVVRAGLNYRFNSFGF